MIHEMGGNVYAFILRQISNHTVITEINIT
jgi:hypothetical protein